MGRSVQLPAPGRGAYDRSLSRAERDQAHRERLFRAAADALKDGPLTIARVVERAGVGRSTFYEFFDSPEHLLSQLQQRILRQLETELQVALAEATSPLERVRAIARRWLAALQAEPHDARVVLGVRTFASPLAPAGQLLHRALQQCVDETRADGTWLKSTDGVSVLAAAAAAEAVARRHLSSAPVRDASRVLSDIIVKLLR